MSNKKYHKSILTLKDYFGFFLLIASSISASLFIFFQYSSIDTSDILSSASINFGNVLMITFICTSIYGIWKHFNVEIPVNRILEETENIMNGQFGNGIEEIHKDPKKYNEFDVIIHNLNMMSKELQNIETLRSDFVSNVSHEMKTPLAAIQNYATLLQENDLSEEERKEYSMAILSSAKHLSELTGNILRLNKLENQVLPDKKNTFNLSEQIIQSIFHFDDAIEEKKINVNTDIEEGIHITADEELLSIVWNNLISNAIKFTGVNGTIEIKVHQVNNQIKVTVSDNGIGMNPDTQKHIFEKFYQGDTSHSEKGNGLGLALVKRIIDMENGEIDVTSKINEGSSFTVTLSN